MANPVDITVPIMSGAKEGSIARNIQRALSSQLRADQFDVEAGEGTNVLVTSAGEHGFSVELIDSDVENVRVAVQSAAPAAPPTVPKQSTPANPPTAGDTASAGDAMPPSNAALHRRLRIRRRADSPPNAKLACGSAESNFRCAPSASRRRRRATRLLPVACPQSTSTRRIYPPTGTGPRSPRSSNTRPPSA